MKLHNEDCIEQMQKMIDEGVQVDSVVTDPPYELGFMGKSWDSTGIAFQPDTWKLAYKLLKPGGHLLAFSGSRTYHRMAVAIEDAGFEIRDQMMWLYGSGFPKSLNLGKGVDRRLGNERIKTGETKTHARKGVAIAEERSAIGAGAFGQETEEEVTVGTSEWEGWGTALKPAHEPVVVARKPLSEKSIVDNVLKHGTGGINIDGCRIDGEVVRPESNPDFRDIADKAMAQGGVNKLNFNQMSGAKRKTTKRKSRSKDGVWTDDNSGMSAEGSVYADADPRGRFPANVMHDGSDVITKEFPQTGKSSGGGGDKTVSKNKNVFDGGWGNIQYEDNIGYGDNGSAARFFYCPKVSQTERNDGLDSFETKQTQGGGGGIGDYQDDVNSASGKFGSEKAPSKNTHPTVKPVELMKYLCRLVTPKGGTVLDPFMGSGSTGIAAKDEGFNFIGIEREKEYYNIAKSRIGSSSPLMDFM